MATLPQRLMCGCIRIYQYAMSPTLGYHCRFHPTCSQYALEAIYRFGSWQGLQLTTKRLLRCHPWHVGGFDPVPETITVK